MGKITTDNLDEAAEQWGKIIEKTDAQLVREFHNSIKIIWVVKADEKNVISLAAKPAGEDVYVGDYYKDSWIDEPDRFEIHRSDADVRDDKYLAERREKSYKGCLIRHDEHKHTFSLFAIEA